MKKKMLALLLSVILIAMALSACGASNGGTQTPAPAANPTAQTGPIDMPETPELSGTLVVYSGMPLTFVQPIFDMFEAETGVRIEFVAAGTGELVARIGAEAQNPLGDVMWGGTLATIKPRMYLFEDHLSVNDPYMREHLRNVEGPLTRFSDQPSVLLVNTELLAEIGVEINGYADLLQPELRGRIAMTNPSTSSSTFEHLINILYAMGEGDPHAGWDFVEAFLENLDGIMVGSSSAVFRGVGEGEYVVGLTYEQAAAEWELAGAPVKIVYMEEGTLFNPNGAYIIRNAPNMENARAFVDFVTSFEIQNYIAQNLNRRSVRDDVPAPANLRPFEQIYVITDDIDYVLANRDAWLERFHDIFQTVS